MSEETIEKIKEFLEDAKDKDTTITVAYDSKFFQARAGYCDKEFDYGFVGEKELAIWGKMVMCIDLSDAIATFNYSEDGDTLKIADSQGNMVTIDK